MANPSTPRFSPWRNLQYDLPAAVVVFLVALPLCLGIALASGAPLFSGLIAGIVGGIVIGLLSKSPLSVSGPAAGLAVIVYNAIQSLPSYEAFLLAVCLAGGFQIILGIARAGVVGDFIPSAVIKGMLAAIGLILILKQIPHAVGYDADFEGDEAFLQRDGRNTFSELFYLFRQKLSLGAIILSSISLIFLFWWDKQQKKFTNFLRLLPGPLIVVLFGVLTNQIFNLYFPDLAIREGHLVAVPVADSISEFLGQFQLPDFTQIGNGKVWSVAITLAAVASIETLLSIEAIDKLDPYRRITPTNRELFAQGVGNFVSGLIGGMPVTSVIVRSSANVSSGARTKASTITHGFLLLICVIIIPGLLNLIPLSVLAAILITVGYKLTQPKIFVRKYEKGWAHLIPFVATIIGVLLTDLLIGVGIGVVVGTVFIILRNFQSAIFLTKDNNTYLVRFKKDVSFMHKYELKKILNNIPENSNVMLDLSRINFIDLDNIEIINDFIINAPYRNIFVQLKLLPKNRVNKFIKMPEYETV